MGSGLKRLPIDGGEHRPFKDGKGQLEVVESGTGMVGRATFEPGWKWSDHVKPIAGTDSCQAAHMGYLISGRMTVVTHSRAPVEPSTWSALVSSERS